MSFLIPAGAAILGGLLGSKGKANAANKQNQYEVDIARKREEARQLAQKQQEQGRMQGIDFLDSAAAGKGYRLPPVVLEALKAGGVSQQLDPNYLIPDAPKQGASILGALGAGFDMYGNLAGKAALDRANVPPGSYSSASAPLTVDGFSGDSSLVDYYKSLLPPDEFSVSDR